MCGGCGCGCGCCDNCGDVMESSSRAKSRLTSTMQCGERGTFMLGEPVIHSDMGERGMFMVGEPVMHSDNGGNIG